QLRQSSSSLYPSVQETADYPQDGRGIADRRETLGRDLRPPAPLRPAQQPSRAAAPRIPATPSPARWDLAELPVLPRPAPNRSKLSQLRRVMFLAPACLRVITRNRLLQLHMTHIPLVPGNHTGTYSGPYGYLSLL